MTNNVLVLGGYGGVGRYVVEYLLKFFDFNIIIGGRNKQKAKLLKDTLHAKYPKSKVDFSIVDATDKNSLLSNFKNIDLAIITATVPNQMSLIAEAALESNIDLMDILMRSDVVDKLAKFEKTIKDKNRIFITQCGFHPGIIAPLIRFASSHFNQYDEAKLMMAMDGFFQQPEAIKEIIYEVIKSNALMLENKAWRKASYKDAVTFDFSEHFGRMQCYPAQMKEIHGIEKELGLNDCAVYTAGFGPYIDNFIFPLAVVLGYINKNLSLNICSRLFFNRIKHKITTLPKAKLVLKASGIHEGKTKNVKISLLSNNSYELTAMALTALLNQYINKPIKNPGLYLMGQITDEKWLIRDLKKMGVSLKLSS
ncbi:saccharopine dehydrogenase NADP-binding domain-containing protein [Winogradskyella sp.]|uniref:saccharopine dehydrogenase NADP-binding domain-containing protein n=1 Tax=Winogradskyella sp. TaxID=1883156 RepID=UPI0026165B1F|nr:saccharopine dehydrogenase NADP-binding domain-containing protein [Winogradskyella sp.]